MPRSCCLAWSEFQLKKRQRQLLALPHKLPGLGVPIISKISHTEYENSTLTTESLCDINQEQRYEASKEMQKIKNKNTITKLKINEDIIQELNHGKNSK